MEETVSQQRGRKHTGEDLCFHHGALLFYNSQQCISSAGSLTVKRLRDPSNRGGTLDRMDGLPASASDLVVTVLLLPLTPALLAVLLKLPSKASVVVAVMEELNSMLPPHTQLCLGPAPKAKLSQALGPAEGKMKAKSW